MKPIHAVASLIAVSGVPLYAQSLFIEDPNEEEKSSLPLTYEVGANAGYDDNFSPTLNTEGESSAYVNAYVGARMVSFKPQTTWKFYTRLSGTKYLSGRDNADIYYDARLGVDWIHRINARTRLSSRSYINYGLEPEYAYSFTSTRRPTDHLFFVTDNAVGHRWTNRLATYTGIKVSGVYYEGARGDIDDRFTWQVYNTFRYGWSPQTNLIADISYGQTTSEGVAGDSTNIIGAVGFEHRFSPYSVAIAKVGTQYRDVDGGRSDYFNPYFEGSVKTRVNEQFTVKAYARYSVEDYETSQGLIAYDTSQTLRVGVTGNYKVSERLSLHGGVNYIMNDFQDGRNVALNTDAGDADQSLLNPFIGFAWKMTENVSLTGSYNYTHAEGSGNLPFRGYDRNRVQVGVNAAF